MSASTTPLLGGIRRSWRNCCERDGRWAFIGKIFFIVFLQLLVAAAVSTLVLNVDSIAHFFKSTWMGLVLYVLVILLVPFLLILIYYNHRRCPQNVILLALFILALGSAVGLICVFIDFGNVIQQTLIVTTGAVVGLTLYAFLASFFPTIGRIGSIPFLLGTSLIIGLFVVSQTCHFWYWLRLGGLKLDEAFLGALAAIVFAVYIVWDTNTLVERMEGSSIWGSMMLYLDVFLKLWPFAKGLYQAATGH